MNQLTFVLPCHAKDIGLVADILLPSFARYLHIDCMHSFILVCPDSHYDVFMDCVKSSLPRMIVLKDSYLLSGTHTTANSWYIQQMLKLLVSRHIHTKWYCTLDADVFLFKPTRFDDFVKEGKCIYNNEPIEQHALWWQASSASLMIPLSTTRTGFGVTPSLMVTEICQELIQEHNVEMYLSKGSTEYTLYWLYLNSRYNYLDYYVDSQDDLYSANSLWGAKQLSEARELGSVANYITKHCTHNSGFVFFVFQSLLKRFSLDFRKMVIQMCFP